MGEQRVEPDAVIDDDGLSGEEQILGETTRPAAGRGNRRAGGAAKVRARMRRARLAVEDAADPKLLPATPGSGATKGRAAPPP
jgi:hypothetical protein